MGLTTEQLAAILNRALPGERLRDSRHLPGDRYAIELAGGERLALQVFESTEAAATAAAALRLLRGEVDLPVPTLRASDPAGETVGAPYLLLGELSGDPIAQEVARIGDEQLYKLGRRLGEVTYRVHRLVCQRYGSLAAEDPGAGDDERGYVLARLAGDIRRCGELGLLDRRGGAELVGWFERSFQPIGRLPALVYGGLGPHNILVRRAERGWSIAGLTGWGQALGWSPLWDHVILLDSTDDARFFSLRVGYGNGYDEQTSRAYEQVREHAMAPYRMLLMLRRMQEAYARGRPDECARRRGVLRGLMRFLDM